MECVNTFKYAEYYPLGMQSLTSFKLFLIDGCLFVLWHVLTMQPMALFLSSPPPCLNYRYLPPSLLSLCSCDKTLAKQTGKGQDLFILQVSVHHWAKWRWECKAGTWRRQWGNAIYWISLFGFLRHIFYIARPIFLGMTLSTVGWAIIHQLAIKKIYQEAGEQAQRLRTLASHVEDPGSSPSTNMAPHNYL